MISFLIKAGVALVIYGIVVLALMVSVLFLLS